ncbi:hypothetical protein [Tunicatimonas pelagia]|uniref:hypothetical protein n=1 Tax=Tunicatimonas pelagia TaxID=931531 RepID=UPI002666C1A6|nr:hypothetical protein [Tunicatimonas pelagia]WKN41482.1 hypothetical protein P0M28_20820 [Tunicatimonas pelagia]
MKHLTLILTLIIASPTIVWSQADVNNLNVFVDIAHGQRFWNDPANMVKSAGEDAARAQYLTNQLKATASSLSASVNYVKSEITPEVLANSNLLFIHSPSAQYSDNEVATIEQYVQQGGSLFLVLDVDYWSTLEQTNVNDIIKPFDIQFGEDSSDTLSGGYATPSVVVSEKMDVIYHGGRLLNGGTPFCFNQQSDEAFGTYKVTESGGKIIVMGDGMASLYMTEWKGVNYPSQQFMSEVIRWLLQ